MTTEFRLSIAIPLHNEERILGALLARTRAALDKVPGGPHEIVFVDDGSTDDTFEMLADAARQDPRITAISLSRNFGHQAALTAALDHVTGDATIVMDGDLQDSPEAIPQFVEKHRQGFDVVYAQRIRRKEPWPLRLSQCRCHAPVQHQHFPELPQHDVLRFQVAMNDPVRVRECHRLADAQEDSA